MKRVGKVAIASLVALTFVSAAAYAAHRSDGEFGGRSSPFVTPNDSDFGRNDRVPEAAVYVAELEQS